jgi:hypothetical protein
MGWFDCDWYPGERCNEVFDSNGNAGPTAWCNGRVVGGWYRDADARVQLQLLEKPGQGARRALQQLAEELTAWLDGVRTSPKFPSRWMTARAACCPTAARGAAGLTARSPYGCGQTTWSLGILAPPDWNPADAIDGTQPLWAVYVGQLGPPTTCQPPIRHR